MQLKIDFTLFCVATVLSTIKTYMLTSSGHGVELKLDCAAACFVLRFSIFYEKTNRKKTRSPQTNQFQTGVKKRKLITPDLDVFFINPPSNVALFLFFGMS